MGLLQLDLELCPELSCCTNQMLTGWWEDDHLLSPVPQGPSLGLHPVPGPQLWPKQKVGPVWFRRARSPSLSYLMCLCLSSSLLFLPVSLLCLIFSLPCIFIHSFPRVTFTDHLLCARPLASCREYRAEWHRAPSEGTLIQGQTSK